MVIRYLGHSSFLIKSKEGAVVIDPFHSDKVGFSFPKVTADIVLVSHDHEDHNNVEAVKPASPAGGPAAGREEPAFAKASADRPFIINGPGEYEVSNIKVWAYPTFHDDKGGEKRGKNLVFLIQAEGLTVCHLGDLGHVLDEKTAEEIGNPDVLLVPTGGVYTINHEDAAKVAAQLESKIVIPMHYKAKGMKETFKDLSDVDAFLNEMGVPQTEARKELKIVSGSLPEEPEVVVLERS